MKSTIKNINCVTIETVRERERESYTLEKEKIA